MIAIMRDMRGDWSGNCKARANKIKELATEMGYPKTVSLVGRYIEHWEESGDADGRFFRTGWETNGGYNGAPDKLKNSKTLTKVYIKAIIDNCNYPEYALGED